MTELSQVSLRPRLRVLTLIATILYIIRLAPRWLRNYAEFRRKAQNENNLRQNPRNGRANRTSSNGRGGQSRLQPAQQPTQQQYSQGRPERGNADNRRVNTNTARRPARRDQSDSSKSASPPALWLAVESGDLASVQKLLQSGVNVNESHKAWTPIMKAAEEGHVEIAQLLLDNSCSLEAVNKTGRTALSFAATPSMGRTACLPVLQLLLEAGANVDHKDSRGETARARAVRDGYRQSVAAIDAFVAR